MRFAAQRVDTDSQYVSMHDNKRDSRLYKYRLDSGGVVYHKCCHGNGCWGPFHLFDELPIGTYTVTVDTTTLPVSKLITPTYDFDGGLDSTSTTTLDEETNLHDRDQDFAYEPPDATQILLGNMETVRIDTVIVQAIVILTLVTLFITQRKSRNTTL